MTKYIVPIFIFSVLLFGFFRKTDQYSCFIDGAKDGISTAIQILPALIALLSAIGMMKASGLMELLVNLLTPLTSRLKIPTEILPLMLMRPISGSGSLAIVSDLLKTYGPDSKIGLIASVMMGATETTFYAISVYFSAAGIKKIRYTIFAALAADFVAMMLSIWLFRM